MDGAQLVNMLTQQLIGEEGERLTAYKDSLGLWTIGIGRLIDSNRVGAGLTHYECIYLLNNDIEKVRHQLSINMPWTTSLDTVRYGVLCNMCFQLGITGLMNFKKFLEFVRTGDYEQASTEMLDSNWASQTPSRANRMSKQMSTGQWQMQT